MAACAVIAKVGGVFVKMIYLGPAPAEGKTARTYVAWQTYFASCPPKAGANRRILFCFYLRLERSIAWFACEIEASSAALPRDCFSLFTVSRLTF